MNVWNSDYEAVPSDTSISDNGDDVIRSIKTETSLRLELEHNFKAAGTPYHKEGLCSVLFSGTTNEINALHSPIGSVAFDTEVKVLKVYNGTSWITQAINHTTLSGLAAIEHTGYLNLTGTDQELEESIGIQDLNTLGGIDLSIDNFKIDFLFGKTIPALELDFVSVGKEIRRSDANGSFADDGFVVGDVIWTYSTNNPGPFSLEIVSDTIMVVTETVVDESDVDVSVFTLYREFGTYVGDYVSGRVYGPALKDCLVWAIVRSPIEGAIHNIKGYSGDEDDADTLTLRVATSVEVSSIRDNLAASISPFPVRQGQYWRVLSQTEVHGTVSNYKKVYIYKMDWNA